MATGRNIGNIWELTPPLEDNNARGVGKMNELSKPGDVSVRVQDRESQQSGLRKESILSGDRQPLQRNVSQG